VPPGPLILISIKSSQGCINVTWDETEGTPARFGTKLPSFAVASLDIRTLGIGHSSGDFFALKSLCALCGGHLQLCGGPWPSDLDASRVKARRGFAVRKVSPTFRFAKSRRKVWHHIFGGRRVSSHYKRRRKAWDATMKRYSIIKMGNEFVVQAEERSVLKCTSRRKAARTVSDANDLMHVGRFTSFRRWCPGRPGTNPLIGNCRSGCAKARHRRRDARQEYQMPGPILTIPELLHQAADALEEAYKERADAPPAVFTENSNPEDVMMVKPTEDRV
jgi:hypothetical protein